MANTTQSKYIKSLERQILTLFRPIEAESVNAWAERELYLSAKITERAGMFSSDGCEYMREPLECFRDPSVAEMTLMFSTQTGKTTILSVGLAYSIDCNPRRAMMAFPTDDVARRFVKSRWQPMADDAECIRRHAGTGTADITNFAQNYDTATVFFTGVGSASKVSSEPIALLIEDEIDKFPLETDREADARSLAEERTKSFAYKLIVRSSTPTTSDGNICTSFKQSDQRYYFIPCPHCGGMITLDFRKCCRWYVREDDGDEWDINLVRQTAHIECPECGATITEREKRAAIARGEWRPTNPTASSGHRGYHLCSLYSPTLTTGDVAAKFVESKEKPQELRNFINSWLAEPWEEETYDSNPEKLRGCTLDYERGEKRGVVRVITVDVQRRDLRYNVRGYDDGGSYLIDWGTLTGWEEVKAAQEKYDATYVGIDINYRDREQEVYDIIYENRRDGWLGIVGAGDRQQLKPFAESIFNPFVGKKKRMKFVKSGIRLLTVKSSLYKGEIARRRSGTKSNWHVYRLIERGYIRELFAEVQVDRFIKGRKVREWKVLREDNHQFDLECYQLAIADWAKLHKHGAIKFAPKEAGEVDKPAEDKGGDNLPAFAKRGGIRPNKQRPARYGN